MRSATHLETFLIKQSMLFLHVSNVSGMRRGMCMRSHASYAEAWCIEYCCHVWAGAPSCYLELLDKLQKRMWRIVGPSLVASLEPLANHRYVASLSLFYRYYFGRCLSLFYRYYFGRCLSLFCRYYCGRCSSELAELVPLPFSWGRSTGYSDRLHDFSVTIPRCYKDVYVNSFFPRTAKLWNSLPIEYFPLTYDLSGFKSRINRHLLTVGSF